MTRWKSSTIGSHKLDLSQLIDKTNVDWNSMRKNKGTLTSSPSHQTLNHWVSVPRAGMLPGPLRLSSAYRRSLPHPLTLT